MSYRSETIATTIGRLNAQYFLPAIQREFVWKPQQIMQLFDSIMRGYWRCHAEEMVDRDELVGWSCGLWLGLWLVGAFVADVVGGWHLAALLVFRRIAVTFKASRTIARNPP